MSEADSVEYPILPSEEYAVLPSEENTVLPAISPQQTKGTNSSKVFIQERREKRKGCKQSYDKINYCTFCEKASTKISRHLLTVHKEEESVRPILFLPKRSKERILALEILSNEGNFKHNLKVISTGSGHCVIARRTNETEKLDHQDFLPCEYCKKFIKKTSLWHHHRQCTVKLQYFGKSQLTDTNNSVRRGRHLLYSALLNDDSAQLKQLFSRMQNDELKSIVANDELIKRYSALRVDSLGDNMVQKVNDMHRVSQGARSLARLVKEMKKKDASLSGLSEAIKPEQFDLVVESAKNIVFHSSSKPLTFARLIGNLLGHAIQVKAGLALRKNSDKELRDAEQFQRLFSSEWNLRVNAIAQKKINHAKRKTVQTLPLTEDLKVLLQYIKSQMTEKMNALICGVNSKDWSDLASLTLCRLILFNKRRRAEVKDLKLQDFTERPDWSKQGAEDFSQSMSTTDRIVYNRYAFDT